MAASRPVPPIPAVDDEAPRAEAKARLARRTAAVAERIGERVRLERLQQGRSQEDVASHTLIARNSLQTIEHGIRSNPRLSTLVGLAETLGVTVADLVADDPYGRA